MTRKKKKKRRAKDSSGNSDSDRIDDSPTHPLVSVHSSKCSCTCLYGVQATLKPAVSSLFSSCSLNFLLSFSRLFFYPSICPLVHLSTCRRRRDLIVPITTSIRTQKYQYRTSTRINCQDPRISPKTRNNSRNLCSFFTVARHALY